MGKKFNDNENVMRMYPVDKVYTPMGEFQIDEVILARWKVKQKKKQEERRKEEELRKKQEEKEREEREMKEKMAEMEKKLLKREEQLKNFIQATNEMPNSTMNSQANNQSRNVSSKAPPTCENNPE